MAFPECCNSLKRCFLQYYCCQRENNKISKELCYVSWEAAESIEEIVQGYSETQLPIVLFVQGGNHHSRQTGLACSH